MSEHQEITPTRPYLIRALHEWCCDNGFTPYVAVRVDESVQVPREFVRNGEIVLNVSFDATSALTLGNEYIEFRARFGGVARDVVVPVSRVMAIYARENGQGMAFPLGVGTAAGEVLAGDEGAAGEVMPTAPLRPVVTPTMMENHTDTETETPPPPPRPAGGARRPALKRVK